MESVPGYLDNLEPVGEIANTNSRRDYRPPGHGFSSSKPVAAVLRLSVVRRLGEQRPAPRYNGEQPA